MDTEPSTEVTGEESGSSLRARLEAEIAAKNAALQANAELAAEVTIVKGGHSLVTQADLLNVPTDQLAAKAAEIQAQRAAERESIFRAEAAARGITLTEAQAPAPAMDPALARVASLGSLGGTPPAQNRPVPSTADEMLDAALGL
jgi:hypothetical protein